MSTDTEIEYTGTNVTSTSTSESKSTISKEEYLEIMQNQPVINIGTFGHVANGKSTLIESLTKVKTQRHSSEKSRGITIKTGYANAKIWKCNVCSAPMCYQSTDSEPKTHNCNICKLPSVLVNHVSFVDNPGHNSFMQTMMNGLSVVDYAIIVESVEPELKNIATSNTSDTKSSSGTNGANSSVNTGSTNDDSKSDSVQFPAPQTREHLSVIENTGIPVKILCLNKFDIVPQKYASTIIRSFRKYMNTHTTISNDIPIVPISATLGINIDVICEQIAHLSVPERSFTNLKMQVIRSFNVNHPRTPISELKGGVLGGSPLRGKISVGDNVMLVPGFIAPVQETNSEAKWQYTPISLKVSSINSDKTPLSFGITGGLIGVQVDIDPGLSCDDNLVGQILTSTDCDTLKVFESIKVSLSSDISPRLVVGKGEVLRANSNSNNVNCTSYTYSHNDDGGTIVVNLMKPICAELNDDLTLSIIGKDTGSVRIVGTGKIVDGVTSVLMC